MASLGLRPNEIENIKFAFGIYQGDGKLDSIYLPSVLRGLNINPSLLQLEELGVSKKEGTKVFTIDEIYAIYGECKKNLKEYGCYEDFIECLKLYDKNENGKMQLGELSGFLLALGEKLTDVEVDELFEDCMPEEDDEGQIDYDPFLKAMCERK